MGVAIQGREPFHCFPGPIARSWIESGEAEN